jgi:hypothetical protein
MCILLFYTVFIWNIFRFDEYLERYKRVTLDMRVEMHFMKAPFIIVRFYIKMKLLNKWMASTLYWI